MRTFCLVTIICIFITPVQSAELPGPALIASDERPRKIAWNDMAAESTPHNFSEKPQQLLPIAGPQRSSSLQNALAMDYEREWREQHRSCCPDLFCCCPCLPYLAAGIQLLRLQLSTRWNSQR